MTTGRSGRRAARARLAAALSKPPGAPGRTGNGLGHKTPADSGRWPGAGPFRGSTPDSQQRGPLEWGKRTVVDTARAPRRRLPGSRSLEARILDSQGNFRANARSGCPFLGNG